MRALVISPHLDDAVLGAGAHLASRYGATVVTVFAGDPGPCTPSSAWDSRIAPLASNALKFRRAEDVIALESLGARPIHLRFLDATYRTPARWHESDEMLGLFDGVRGEIAEYLRREHPDVLFVPLGLAHVDHVLVSGAALSAWIAHRSCPLFAYAEQPYDAADVGAAHARLRAIRPARVRAVAPSDSGSVAAKIRAAAAYRSQLALLGRAFPNWTLERTGDDRVWQLGFHENLGRFPKASTNQDE